MKKEKIKTIINDDWCHMFTPAQEPYSTIPPAAPPIPQEPYWYAGSEETELTHFLRKC